MQVRALSPPSAITPTPRTADPAVEQPQSGGNVPEDRVTLPGARPTGSAQPSADRPGEKPKKPGLDAALTTAEQQLVDSLRQRDREVRAHEAAHQAAGGTLTGGASFTYETGPDGRSYAVGGEVPISMAQGRSPAETIAIARQIRAAALAPADPSGQDLRVASEAASLEMQATLEQLQQLTQQRAEARGSHLHSSEPCGACAKAADQYASSA